MAIDTAPKRGSALNFGNTLRMPPLPDGTIAQADRQHLLGLYGGILAEAPVVVATGPLTEYMRRLSQTDGSLRSLSASNGTMRKHSSTEECLRHLS